MAVRVETAQGTLEGLDRRGCQVFLGIPFAKPPIGERRWRAPEAPEPWSGVRTATEIGDASIQGQHPVPGMAASGPRSEDCLTLNVFTPAADGARRPVLFWIHGGGFQLGSGSEALCAHQPRTHLYLFVQESPARRGTLGACHALELAFVFGTLDAPTQDRFAGSGPAALKLSAQMMDAWLGFARAGNPSHPGIGAWPGYQIPRRPTLVFGPDTRSVDAPLDEERALWDELSA